MMPRREVQNMSVLQIINISGGDLVVRLVAYFDAPSQIMISIL